MSRVGGSADFLKLLFFLSVYLYCVVCSRRVNLVVSSGKARAEYSRDPWIFWSDQRCLLSLFTTLPRLVCSHTHWMHGRLLLLEWLLTHNGSYPFADSKHTCALTFLTQERKNVRVHTLVIKARAWTHTRPAPSHTSIHGLKTTLQFSTAVRSLGMARSFVHKHTHTHAHLSPLTDTWKRTQRRAASAGLREL